MLIHELINHKLNFCYRAERVGDDISSTLSFFDCVNLICAIKNINPNKIKELNYCWKVIHSYSIRSALKKTIYYFDKDYNINNIQDVKDFIKIKKPSKEVFNRIFKIYYKSDSIVKKANQIIKSWKLEFEPIINEYLSEEIKGKKIISSPTIKGGIGYID